MDSRRHGPWHRSVAWAVVIAAMSVGASAAPVTAQGITTGSIRGRVLADNGADVDATVVRVVNQVTGVVRRPSVRNGVFVIEGLEIGGPYAVEVRRIGYARLQQTGLYLRLGERLEVDFPLVALAARLDTLRVTADAPAPAAIARGVGTAISDSMLRRLPALNADMYDFARVVPQVGTRFGLSGGGGTYRLNNYMIDGISDRGLQGNNSPSKGISLDAVKEYQVLLSPFDPRFGDFTGLLVNAVTKSGTNELHGSAYGYFRSAALARSGSLLGTSAYDRELYGVSIGGPIIRNRVHFFLAPEIQRAIAPARGPYVGQGDDAPTPLPVPPDAVARFASLMRAKGLDGGDGGRVMLPNPSVTAFGRVDVALPEVGSRLVVRANASRMNLPMFQRSTKNLFQLTSVAGTTQTAKQTAAVQLFSQLSPTIFNEFQMGHTRNTITGVGTPRMPSILVSVDKALLSAGPGPGGQGSISTGITTEIADYLTFQPWSNHTLGLGGHVEFFRYSVAGIRLAYGQWTFPSLNAFEAGTASQFVIGKDEGSAGAPVLGAEPSIYASDEWRVNDGVSITLGLRGDGLVFRQHPAYNPEVDAVFLRRTTDYPVFRPQWSPRVGFKWGLGDDQRTSIRGGAGVFVGRPPLAWLLGPMRSIGSGVRTLACSGAAVPTFTPYPAAQPAACADGVGPSNGAVTLVDRHLNMGESFRASLAVDRSLPWNATAGIEALYSRMRSDFVFSNLALRGPFGVDPHGRVMYGTFDASGVAQPVPVPGNTFPEVVDVRNQSGGGAWSITGRVQRPWSDRFEVHASYTYSRVRDVNSVTSVSAVAPLDIWAGERPTSGRRDDTSIGTSSFEIPHRVVVSASYVARWKHRTTDISVYYIGESGTPFTFGDSTVGRANGDLNADGTSADDPIYVPRDARDPSEIVFAGDSAAMQGAMFERFIDATPCLRRQRRRIAARNSCRGSWMNTSNLSVRQSLPPIWRHAATIQLDVFNVLNLMSKSWRLVEVPNPWILQYVGRTKDVVSQPIFKFDPTNTRTPPNADSAYQLQLSLRYSF